MCFDFYYRWKYGITPPKIMNEMSSDSIYKKIKEELTQKPLLLKLYDTKYKSTTIDEIDRFLTWSFVDKNLYIPEFFDCDNFAIGLFGEIRNKPKWSALPFGLCSVDRQDGTAHAVNIFIDLNYEMWYIEPQNDKIYKIEEKKEWKPYFILI